MQRQTASPQRQQQQWWALPQLLLLLPLVFLLLLLLLVQCWLLCQQAAPADFLGSAHPQAHLHCHLTSAAAAAPMHQQQLLHSPTSPHLMPQAPCQLLTAAMRLWCCRALQPAAPLAAAAQLRQVQHLRCSCPRPCWWLDASASPGLGLAGQMATRLGTAAHAWSSISSITGMAAAENQSK
jgi:hypothetical protein